MGLGVNVLLFDELTSDPSGPVEGQMWFNTTDHLFKIYRNGVTTSFTDKVAFDAHANSTSNPHTTTLEQARTAGNTLSGNIAMGTHLITGLGDPLASTDATNQQWVKDHVDSKLRGLDPQDSVLDMDLTAPPGTPAIGDRHIIAAIASGLWTGKENQIAEWSSTGWLYTVPNKGYALYNEEDNRQYVFNGTAWVDFGGAIATGTPVEITDATNAGGAATTVAKSDHQHAHGQRSGGNLHATVSTAGAGFQPKSNRAATANPTVTDDGVAGYLVGSSWFNVMAQSAWVCLSNATGAAVWKEMTNVSSVLGQKAGVVAAAGFAGNPKKATVTFATAFGSTAYAVQVTCVTTNNKTFAPTVESKLAASFVINTGTNNIADLVEIEWHATQSGESA